MDIIVYPEIWEELSKRYKVVTDGDFVSIIIGHIQVLGKDLWFTDLKYGSVKGNIDNAQI